VDPETHEHYRCEILQDVFADAPVAPAWLFKRMAYQRGGYVPIVERDLVPVPVALERLDPMLLEGTGLFECMMMFHVYTGGAGREAFVEWAISHASYAGHKGRVEALWDSFKSHTVDGYYDSRIAGRFSRTLWQIIDLNM
jgi:hypothetical protein